MSWIVIVGLIVLGLVVGGILAVVLSKKSA